MAETIASDRSTIRDLVALTALPGVWVGRDVQSIVTGLADAMLSMLRLDLAYVRVCADGDPRWFTAMRATDRRVSEEAVAEILAPWLHAGARAPHELCLPGGDSLRVSLVPCGVGQGDGVVVAASARPTFPDDRERLLLRVAANLAMISIQSVRARDAAHRALREAEEQTAIVETVNRIGLQLGGQTDLHALVQFVTDETTALTGAQFGAFFYNVTDACGDAYTLYTLSGAPRQAFENFPMPRATRLFAPTFRGERIIRIDDVTTDPRYGENPPYRGMPPGHLPVRSYLAVPVVSRRGGVIGGLFFGHAERGVFPAALEKIMSGVAAMVAVAIDNARLLEQEQRARAAAEAASRGKEEFLAVLSHELRTPLNAVYGWAHMIRSGQVDTKDLSHALDIILRNAHAQVQLVDDLLDVSRIATGKMRLEVRAMDLIAVVEAALDAVRPAADARDVRIDLDLDPGAAGIVGDPDRLQQVIWNLLTNAVKFTPRGGRVCVHLTRVDSNVEVTVSDTGEGIDAGLLPYVFDRFRQEDSSSTRVKGGLGLGLALVRHLVELHGGSVAAASTGKGQGATFTIRLPEGLPRPRTPSRVPVANAPVGQAGGLSLHAIRVLVVEDDADSRELIMSLLAHAGAEVRACSSVAEAFATLAGWKPDVIVSDIAMPEEDGYALIQRLRALAPADGGRIPAIALTAYGRVEDRVRTLAAGFSMHVPKPVDPVELATVVASLAGR
jgi:signal transduction histidine kinase